MQKKNTTDMTTGGILSHILIFAIPLFIGNIFQQCYNIVDTAIAGHFLGDDALASVGATSTLCSLIIGFSCGMNNGYAIVFGQLYGGKKHKEMKNAIGISLVLNVILIGLMTSGTLIGLRPLLHVMNVPMSVFSRAYSYIFLVFAGLGATMLYNLEAGIMRALGNSRVPLYFVICSSVLNAGFNVFNILVLHMDVEGLALGTVCAQVCCVVGCFIYMKKAYPELHLTKGDFMMNREMAGNLLTSGFAMSFMYSLFNIGSVILQSGINKLDESIITAHTAARRILEVFLQPFATLATATSTFVSQNYGAGKKKRIVRGMKITCLSTLTWAAFCVVFIRIFGESMIRMLTGSDNPVVITNAVMNLRINLYFFFFIGTLLIVRSSMQGYGQKIMPLFSSGIELVMKVFATIYLIPRFGYWGASFAEPITWLLCMMFLLVVLWFDRERLRES